MTNFPIVTTLILFYFYIYAIVLSLRVPTLWMSFVIVFFSQIFLILFLLRKYRLKDILINKRQKIIFIIQLIPSFIPVLNFFPWLIWFIYLDYKSTIQDTSHKTQDSSINAGGVGFDLEKIKEEIKAEIQKDLQKEIKNSALPPTPPNGRGENAFEKKVINQILIESSNEIEATPSPLGVATPSPATTGKTRLKGLHYEIFKRLNVKNKKGH